MKIANFDTKDKVFIIAELSANHSGDLKTAIETIKAAKRAGADAIKLQTYTPDSLTLNSYNDDFIIKGGLWDNRRFYELYEQALTPREWHKELFKVANDEGLICFSTPFCEDDTDFLEQFNPPAYKIASFEANDPNFIKYVASKKRPMIISTGIIDDIEIIEAINACKSVSNDDIAILKCTSSYPAPLSDMNLKTISAMKEKFGVEVGFSDHSLGVNAPIMAVALGARIIEKHFILNKDVKSVDEVFSLDESEFKQMCKAVREAEEMLGEVSFEMTPKIIKNREFSRSLYACRDIKKGEKFSSENIRSIRPGYGLHPKFKNELFTKVAKRDICFAQKITMDDLRD
ncbi:pseudaminic acid synthase [Campylobacter mucosalis]|uniref:pseudaminic acid synthase n=1 Tax=Campylobacter mucosalis TaxID=202 RepID=UPI001470478F|nr:pseudaminic acid synthase [Campylobacter mucosalis]